MRAKVDKDFIRTLENLREKYGSDFENLNGLSEEHLNGNEFLQMFTETTVVADVSVDSSSNVKQKDVVTMRSELSKAREKWIAYHKIFMTLHELFGLRVAKKWFEAEWTKALYMHDANTSTLIPYSYKGTETIVVKYKDKLLLTSFSDLYDIVQEKETLLSKEDKAYCKYTEDLFVWDTENQWTKVIRVIRKPKTSDFHWIKTANGMSEIVTSNHPVITTDGDVLAEDILENEHKLFTEAFTDFSGNIDTLYCTDLFDNLVFRGFPYKGEPLENKEGQVCRDVLLKGRKGTNPIQNRLDLDFDLGWMLGFILAEGHLNNELVHITQQNNPYLQHAIDICEKKNWGYSIYKHNKDCYSLVLQSQVLGKVFFEKFIIGNNAVDKHLNPEILQYNKEFLKGIIGGVLDGDGTCTQKQGRRIHIRMTSRTLINQLAFIVRMFGYTVREQSPCLYTRNTSYESKHLIYHMAFTPIEELESFDSIKIKEHCAETPREKDIQLNSNSRYEFGVGESFVLNNTVITDEDKYVYDISVETGHFMCNNILSHNCFAYDLQRTAEEGLFWLKDREPMKVEPAKHLETFVDFIKEFISFTSNRTSGACGLPNLIPYMYYFWKEDVKKKAYPRNQNPKQFAKANIQRLIYAMNQPYCRDRRNTVH